jgi:hypothetical protein
VPESRFGGLSSILMQLTVTCRQVGPPSHEVC